MTETAHTPGPWEAATDKGSTYVYIHADTWMDLARVAVRPVPYSETETVKQGLANVHLIAAAPDLLEALKEAKNGLRYWEPQTAHGASERARICALTDAAIAKAEGRA